MNQILIQPKNSTMQYLKKNQYCLQFWFSFSIALIFLCIFITNIYQMNQQEKISKRLLNNYSLTTLYQNLEDTQNIVTTEKVQVNNSDPFVIGMIRIDKINLNYPILSESNYDLLKISLCRFAGPMPNEIGNLCIAGHNYVDYKLFSRLHELENGDKIDIYDLNGTKITYAVFDKFEVKANDLSCTNQNVGENRIITLLTCNNINGKRTIIKAKEYTE
jgi:LPXTG-site transpeptidase (sortase) family protein